MRALTITAGKANSLDLNPPVCDVSANRDHYQTVAKILARADQERLSRLITRRTPLQRWCEALQRNDDDIKVVIDFAD
jgi:threonine dehydrogenase-like Zn-dependent dehydrogenase